MSLVFTQTNEDAPLGVIQACSPVAPSGDAVAIEAVNGGTAGDAGVAIAIPAGTKVTAYADELRIADDHTLASGTYTHRLNVITAQADLTLEDIYVCRVASDGTSQETLGSATGLATDISAGGVFTTNITLTAASAHNAGDRVYVTVAVNNAHTHTGRDLEILPNQNQDTPFTAAAQSFELSLDPGTYTKTGVAASLIGGFALSAAVGAMAVTGVSATTVADRALSQDVGSYAQTGVAATLEGPAVGFELALDPGTYAVTGVAATTVADRVLSQDAGSYALTGVAAETVAGRALSADTGTYTQTGVSATLMADRLLSLDAGSYATSGVVAQTIADRVLSQDAGAYALTGVTADLVHETPGALELALDAGSYAQTGVAASLAADRVLSLGVGSYALTGVAATIVAARSLALDTGAYAATGVALTTVADRTLSADAGTFTVTGVAVTFVFAGSVAVPPPNKVIAEADKRIVAVTGGRRTAKVRQS